MAVAAASLHEKQMKYESLRPKIFSENSFIVDEELAEEAPLCEKCCDLMGPATDNTGCARGSQSIFSSFSSTLLPFPCERSFAF